MRCRNGAKSGLASGMRIDFDDLAAGLHEAGLECGFRFDARRPIVDQRDDALAAVLERPFGHDPGLLAQHESRRAPCRATCVVVTEAPELITKVGILRLRHQRRDRQRRSA